MVFWQSICVKIIVYCLTKIVTSFLTSFKYSCMNSKILLLAISAAAFSSCTSTYKSGQTPDDVYYSPVRKVEAKQENRQEEARETTPRREDYVISMSIHDRRWRDFDDDYDYRYSPYHYCYCNCNNYGYYYNPYYHRWPVYIPKYVPVNSTPRMVNLNTYRSMSNTAVTNPKMGNTVNWVRPSATYINTNRSNASQNKRQVLTPSNNSSSENNTRTYTPSSTPSNNNNSTPSSGSSNNSGSVTRPNRGG